MKPLPGDWSSQLVFSKISMGCFGWFFMGWFLVLFSFFMVNEVFGVYFVELVWSNRLRLICYHSGACRFGRWEPPCHAMTASRCSIIRSNSVERGSQPPPTKPIQRPYKTPRRSRRWNLPCFVQLIYREGLEVIDLGLLGVTLFWRSLAQTCQCCLVSFNLWFLGG